MCDDFDVDQVNEEIQESYETIKFPTKVSSKKEKLTEKAPNSKAINPKLKVPASLNIYYCPDENEISSYLDKLMPHLQVSVGVKLYDRSESRLHDIIADFLVWFLSPGKYGVARYKRYDPVSFPDLAFWAWVVCNLRFFQLSYFKKEKQVSQIETNISISTLSAMEESEDSSYTADAFLSYEEAPKEPLFS